MSRFLAITLAAQPMFLLSPSDVGGAGNGEENGIHSVTELTIQGMTFRAPQPYKEGDVLSAGEASALNQTYAENLRNNFAARIKDKVAENLKALGVDDPAKASKEQTAEAVAALDKAVLDTEFATYADEYEFGVRRGGRILDPIEKEIRGMASEIVKGALRAKGFKLNSVTPEQMDKLIAGVIESRPELRTEAERRVEALKGAADVELGDLGKTA